MKVWTLVPIVLMFVWWAWAAITLVRTGRESPTVQAALRSPLSIEFRWRDRPHLAFSAPHIAAFVRELEAAGFQRIGALEEAAGLARIPELVFLSSDGEVRATVWLWMRLAWGQLKAHVNFISETTDGTLVYTTDGSAPLSAPGLEAQAGFGSIADRLRMHRALLSQQPTEPRRLDATTDEMDRISLTFYERTPPRDPVPEDDVIGLFG
jgi:hypothetical protein